MKRIGVLLTIVLSVVALHAQESLTLERAVDIALKNNFDILVARNDADISKINNTRGNAGMLPTVSLNGSGSYAYNDINQKLSGGTINKYSGQSTTVMGANTELDWTLYDGGKMFITKRKLNELQSLGEIQYTSRILGVTYDVIGAYYDIVRQKQTLASLDEVIRYNKQRVAIAQTSYNSGLVAKTELLQAKIDLNVAIENAINQKYVISESQKTLNGLLGKEATAKFEVSDSIPPSQVPDKNEILLKLEASNTDIRELKKQIDIADLTLKEARKGNSPLVNFQGGYYFSQTNNSEGSTLRNRTNGLQVGGSLSIPLYTGGETKRKVSVAKMELLTAQYDLDHARLQLNIELENAYTDYENQQQLLEIEKENNLLAKENMDICLHRLELGQTISLEVHQAQENYVQSSTRLISIKYNLKMQETKLKQLVSSL